MDAELKTALQVVRALQGKTKFVRGDRVVFVKTPQIHGWIEHVEVLMCIGQRYIVDLDNGRVVYAAESDIDYE